MGNGSPRQSGFEGDFEALRERFAAHSQDHVFRFWPELDAGGRERLAHQAAGIDLDELGRVQRAQEDASEAGGAGSLEPIAVERIPSRGGDAAAFAAARERGEALLGAGRASLLVVAGGQATRLGFDGPKGAFPIGPVTGRTLFELQAQKIRRLRDRFGQPVPWYVMTSPATDAPTRDHFEKHAGFDLPAEDVFFLCQGMVPSLDLEGRLMLDRKDHIFENPNGHGGTLTALVDSGALDDMERRGCDTIFYYQVDNPLIAMGDPTFLGFHDAAGAEMSCKVVAKSEPGEKVGVLARRAGALSVVEYTEISETEREARDATGELVYWAGNTAIHAFGSGFVRRVAADAERLLPYHASQKQIPYLDESGAPVAPASPNGRKLERFIFDALPAAGTVCVVETDRTLEFSPVKNADGADSPETSRRDLVARYRAWLEEAGISLPSPGVPIEIDHSVVDGPEDARSLGVRSIEEARDVIRVGSGAIA